MGFKLGVSAIFLAFVAAVGAFIVLAVWDVQVPRSRAEKQVDVSRLSERKS